MNSQFRARLKSLRKEINKTQDELAKLLGVTTGYISKLEQGLYIPSDQLILSLCRIFHVLPEWLKTGKGDKYDNLEATYYPLVGAIYKALTDRRGLPFSATTYAVLVGLDPWNPNDDNKRVSYPFIRDADELFCTLMEIFAEGDATKIEAVRGLLLSLKPQKAEEDELRAKNSYYKRRALSIIDFAKHLETLNNLIGALKEYQNGSRLTRGFKSAHELIISEYAGFLKRHTAYSEALETIITTVKAKPGIKGIAVERRLKLNSGEERSRICWAAEDLGFIKSVRDGSSILLYPIDQSGTD